MSTWYRRSGLHRRGLKEFTRSGFENAKKQFQTGDLDVDCSDKHFLVTGANRGIGLEIATEVAKRGGIVHFLCRNRQSMLEARSHVITTTGNDRLHMHTLDLSRPRDVSRWAQDFVTTHTQLDVLINNAAAISEERQLDEDDIEYTFAINTLAVHILTIILLPLLQQSNDGRVINISSAELLKVKLETSDFSFEKMVPYDPILAYAQTKRQQTVLSFCYAQRYEGIYFFSMHPGWVDTELMKQSQPELYTEIKSDLRAPSEGADTAVWLALSSAAKKHTSGTFFQDRLQIASHLPLAWTRHSLADEKLFYQNMDKLLAKVSPHWISNLEPSSNLSDVPTISLEITPCEPDDISRSSSVDGSLGSSNIEVSEDDDNRTSPIFIEVPENTGNTLDVSSPNTGFEIHKIESAAQMVKLNGVIARHRSLSTILEGSDASSLNSFSSTTAYFNKSSSLTSINLDDFGVTFTQGPPESHSYNDLEVQI